jgi:CheY-like chemotaxis protein
LIVANIYRNKFSVEGYQMETALDGLAGLETVRSFRPDAVILDLMVPKMTGVELMKKLRSEPDFQKLPVIVFSNAYMTSMVQEAWKAGATKCLSKANCTPKQLIDVVRGALFPNGAGDPASAPLGAARVSALNSALPPPSTPADQIPSGDPDAAFQADLRKSFLEGLPPTLAALRAALQGLIKADNEVMRLKQVHEMYRRVRALTGNAGVAGMARIACMSDAFEALLKELHEKPKNLNSSTLRMVASAVDFLGLLFERGIPTGLHESPAPKVLVVDDEAISRRAVVYALEKAKLKSVDVEDPAVAYDMLLERSFDLIILDVDMPGMNGFELCTKLRTLPAYNKTPVVFVTGLNDFESRANSTVSGGNDFIAKPFLFIELAVKALVYVLQGRLKPAK